MRFRNAAAVGVFIVIVSSISLFQRRHDIIHINTLTEKINSETLGVVLVEDAVAPTFNGGQRTISEIDRFVNDNNEGNALSESHDMHQSNTSTTNNRRTILGSKGSWKIEYNDNTLSCTIGIKTSDDTATLTTRNANETPLLNTKNKFVIHIHGLQHTGTGYLRMVIYEGVGSGSNASLQRSSVYEDEGQHMQTVYPRGHHRMAAWKKSKSHNISQFTYLPDLCEIHNPFETGEELMQQWSEYWNMTQHYLIQKTPFMDVEFLERVKIMPTFHAIIMRHPLVFSKFLASHGLNDPVDYLLLWLDTWAHTLRLLSTGNVEMYAVVTYESLVRYHDSISNELTAMIQGSFISNSRTPHFDNHRNRRLDLHEGNNPSKYLEPNKATIRLWKKCLQRDICKSLLQEINQHIFPKVGYDLEDNIEPHAIQIKENFGRVLFSPSIPPSTDLLDKLGNLTSKLSYLGS